MFYEVCMFNFCLSHKCSSACFWEVGCSLLLRSITGNKGSTDMLNWVELYSLHLISWEYRYWDYFKFPKHCAGSVLLEGKQMQSIREMKPLTGGWKREQSPAIPSDIVSTSLLLCQCYFFFCHYELLLTHSLLPPHFLWFRFSLCNSLVQIPKAKLIVWNDHMHLCPYLQLWTTFFKFQKHFIDSSRIVFRSLSPAPSPPSSTVCSTLNPYLESEFLITQVFWPSHERPEVSYG